MLIQYRAAKDIEKAIGADTILVRKKVDGKVKEVEMTIWDQQDELQTYKLSDKRHSRYPTFLLDINELQLDVGRNESVVICDWDGL